MQKTMYLIVLATLCLIFTAEAQTPISPSPQKSVTIIGKVISASNGETLPGAVIKITTTNQTAVTNDRGVFSINLTNGTYNLSVYYLGHKAKNITIQVPLKEPLIISLETDDQNLKEVEINAGYYTVTDRERTGSISTITAETIAKQPVTNVLSALSGRMPGVFVQTTNGLPGGNINIQIRGKGSIAAGTAPLYIIDGVPFESAMISSGSILAGSTLSGAINPLNSLNPGDIESISVLKDADATSIYGSRGSNGVILISTKKGMGMSSFTVNVSQGTSKASNSARMLSLKDYLDIRREAYANDKVTPTLTNAPDLLVWNQTQDTNWSKYIFGNTAHYTDVQTALNGGGQQTTFNASTNLHRQNTIISDQAKYLRGGIHVNISHTSLNKKLLIVFSNSLVLDRNSSPNVQNVSSGILLPPNFPLTDDAGQYIWRGTNPLAEMNASTLAKTDNLISNLAVNYEIFPSLTLKITGGYTKFNADQTQLYPLNSLTPGSVNYSQFAKNSSESFITEPQISYSKKFEDGKLNLLLGGTYQNKITDAWFFKVSNFSNEELMENFASATTVDTRTNQSSSYKYLSAYGRVSYALADRYIINATLRRDGSSRFGESNRYGNFGSIGAAWIFSSEKLLDKLLPALSYGKLRTSYGTTGNDQIQDYQFLSTYGSSGYTYQGIATLKPSKIDNANFHWETTRKIDIALELGWLNNRILFNANYYTSRSKDQLVQYPLSRVTGFTSYQANLPATVQNTGWELELNTRNIVGSSFKWVTSFNITIPRNKLVKFNNLEESAYAQTLEIGYDITRITGYEFLGVDPQTGIAGFAGQNGELSTTPYAYSTIGKQTPDCYGGMGNTFSYGNFSFEVFFQFSKQYLFDGIRTTPGLLINNYAFMANRWQKLGDMTDIPKASTLSVAAYSTSSANYFDASYVRLKNVVLSYTLPTSVARKLSTSSIQVFIRAQNLLTFWNRDNPFLDPESGALSAAQRNIPPVKSLVSGIEFKF